MKFVFLVMIALCAISASAQRPKPRATPVPAAGIVEAPEAVRSSPAYAELLLRKTELTADLESLSIEYTEEFPKIREAKYAIALLERDLTRLATVKPADAGKLTLAVGKLMRRRIEVETELGILIKSYKDEHPDVKRLKKKLEIFEAAIKEILG
jgi:hypothetical protein